MDDTKTVKIEMRLDFLKKMQSKFDEYTDSGLEDEGWKSKELSAINASLSKAIQNA